jgi:hypothetical protein
MSEWISVEEGLPDGSDEENQFFVFSIDHHCYGITITSYDFKHKTWITPSSFCVTGLDDYWVTHWMKIGWPSEPILSDAQSARYKAQYNYSPDQTQE